MNAMDLPLPAHSIEAEQAVLGCLLLDGRSWDRIADLLAAQDFYRDDHRRIFSAIHRLAATSKTIDVLTVNDGLEHSNEAQLVGGIGYLGDIANGAPSAARIKAYAEIIVERRMMRDLQAAVGEIDGLANSPGQETAQDRITKAQAVLLGLADNRPNQKEPRAIGAILANVVDDMQMRYDSDRTISGLSTGLIDLDRMTCGLQNGDLIIIAGRPSMGKTALALNIAENTALDGKTALVFSLEMGDRQLGARTLASHAQVSMERIRSGNLNDDDWPRVAEALGRLHAAPLMIDEASSPSVIQMRARASRIKRQQGLSLIVIDYLQLMSTGDRRQNRNEDLSEITRGLKLMAKDLDVPIILLSQLSRKCEERQDKRPLMSDLRESGAIEQDADVIAMIYREDQYRTDSPWKGFAEILIRKQRMGPTGECKAIFEGKHSRFLDADPVAVAEAEAQEKLAAPGRKQGFKE